MDKVSPELLHRIAAHLPRDERKNAALVHKFWYTPFILEYWTSVRDNREFDLIVSQRNTNAYQTTHSTP